MNQVQEELPFEESTQAVVPLPDFKKMKKKELVDFFEKHAPKDIVETVDEFKKLTVPTMKLTLQNLYPNPEALDSPEVTGFDGADPIHATIAQVKSFKDHGEAVAYINELNDENTFNFFRIGGALSEIQNKSWYGEYDDFGAFVEGEFGFKLRKAQYLISIYCALVSCDCKWDEVKDVGWAKLAMLAPYLNPENYKKLFAQISTYSFSEVQDLAKKLAGATGDGVVEESDSSPKKVLKFHVHEDQVETIQQAIDKAKTMGETKYEGPALEYMALDFLASPSSTSEVPAETASAGVTVTEENAEDVLLNVIKVMVENAGEPVEALEALLTAVNDFFVKDIFPDFDVDIYPYGKPADVEEME